MNDAAAGPNPGLFFDTINAYQKSAALKAAIELEIFTHIGETPATAPAIAARCGAAERGVRILCDYLTVLGFLTKAEDRYALTPDSAFFLSKLSPAYIGGAVEFFLEPSLMAPFSHLTAAVRQGGTAESKEGTTSTENPVWLRFARGMGPLMKPTAEAFAEVVAPDAAGIAKILDVSASHGEWGIALARRAPRAELVALDWAPVLEITREKASEAGLAERFRTIAGDAFTAELGTGYDLVLVPNFLHHFDYAGCVRFLKRAHAALKPGGRVAVAEFVPNPDRVTPPPSATFSLVMLATTPAGDAYTFAELAAMLTEAGFRDVEQQPVPGSPSTAVMGTR
jgi:SAM-dependent methyltransferase